MKTVVVIPTHKNNFNEFERVSLTQTVKVLSKYDIYFAIPQSLSKKKLEDYPEIMIERFDDDFFKSHEAYNRFCISEELYQRFSKYDYMLICQTDAFVFSDRLQEFVALGYDYIGAPARGEKGYAWGFCHVGNGGLSLRNIKSCLRMVKQKEKVLKCIALQKFPDWGEDVFFSFCGKSDSFDFSVPCMRVAADFSTQTDVAKGLRKIAKEGLPFGCHMWSQTNYHWWKPEIEKYGYKLPHLDQVDYVNSLTSDNSRQIFYLAKRHARNLQKDNRKLPLSLWNPYTQYAFWGGGKLSERFLDMIKKFPYPIKINRIYDKAWNKVEVCGIQVEKPTRTIIKQRNEFIIISTSRYEWKVKQDLLDMGMREYVDFSTFFDLFRPVALDYLCELYKKSKKS